MNTKLYFLGLLLFLKASAGFGQSIITQIDSIPATELEKGNPARYPFKVITENGKVVCEAIPYAPLGHDRFKGQTTVSVNGKRLYTIDQYLHTPFVTAANGRYVVLFRFDAYCEPQVVIVSHGTETKMPRDCNVDAITLFKDGKLIRTIRWKELGIDIGKYKIKNGDFFFSWSYKSDENDNALKRKMEDNPVFYDSINLYVLTMDNQLLTFELNTGNLVSRKPAYEALQTMKGWVSDVGVRSYKQIKYPNGYQLPTLSGNSSLEKALAAFLKMPSVASEEDATFEIYIDSLMINQKGQCEEVVCSIYARADASVALRESTDCRLAVRIEDWIKKQKFDTRFMPKGFPKYVFSVGALYFK